MSDAVVELIGLKRSFVQAEVTIEVLRGIDLAIRPGEIVALLGPSGSGKSTMLQAIGLLEGGFTGTIRLMGTDASTLDGDARTTLRREHLGFVYQFHHLLPDFSAIENVVLPQLVAGAAADAAQVRAGELLSALGLGHRLDHRPSQLSGGEQQRVAVARALANRPALVLADEPTGNLDEATAGRVLDEFLRLVREHGSAALIATHNEALAARMDRVLRLHEGKLDCYLASPGGTPMTDKPLEPIDWDHYSELHEKKDGGGMFSSALALRQGRFIDLVRFVASIPSPDRDSYIIEKGGDHRFDAAEIVALTHRPDYPG